MHAIRIILMGTAVFSLLLSVNAKDKKNITVKVREGKPAPKIAVVNMETLFEGYYKTKLADISLKKQAEIFKAYAQKLNESRLKLQEEFKALRDASQNIALSEAARESKRLAAQDKYRQLKTKEAEFEQYNREKQSQIREEYEKKRNEMVKEIKTVVEKQCVTMGYSLVLDVSGKTLNNIPSVIYYTPPMDLTEKVLKELNRGHEDEVPTED